MSGLYVQYGCGYFAPDGWLNFDASPTLRFERLPIIGLLRLKNGGRLPSNARYGDITKGLPIADGSAAGVYACHVLEHLAFTDFHIALRNTIRLLKPGGIFRLIVPDLRWRAEAYLRNGDSNANSAFLRSVYLGMEVRSRSLRAMVISAFGNSSHLWMWDEPGMREALQSAGFQNIRRATMGDAVDPMFATVEHESRFFYDGQPELAMEAIKPHASRMYGAPDT